jgi:hypothetical protein
MKIILLITIFCVYGLTFTVWAQEKRSELSVKENDVRVIWLKDSLSTQYFEVERKSAQSGMWKVVNRQYADEKIRYTFENYNLRGQKYFYRVKAVLKDGSHFYSDIMEADLNSPFGFNLNQNFPNPFNPETAIKYSIPAAGFVDLRIYNLLGQEVQILVSEYKEAGEYVVHFRADELNSGLYIYKLISGDKVLTRKMTLIK